jgi:hypothetical protein
LGKIWAVYEVRCTAKILAQRDFFDGATGELPLMARIRRQRERSELVLLPQ